jgi:UTP--glucose-1-phosphate uridylyltransferase
MKIRKAVIPIAGKGTRFLPATKEISKEIIPILNRPMIDFVVEEAILAGVEQLIFVTASGKEEIENFYDRNFELENFLASKGKQAELELVKKIGSKIEIITVRQKEQLGLGHAVSCAKNVIGNEPFAVLLGDDIIISKKPVIAQLAQVMTENNANGIIGVMKVAQEDVVKYGIIDGNEISNNCYHMRAMVEKPKPELAPTCLATPGRYILPADIFKALEEIPRGSGGEYQLTDAINLITKTHQMLAYVFDGKRYDTGSLEGYLEATIDIALADPSLSQFAKSLIINRAGDINA